MKEALKDFERLRVWQDFFSKKSGRELTKEIWQTRHEQIFDSTPTRAWAYAPSAERPGFWQVKSQAGNIHYFKHYS